jgi:hypothetical protein
MSARAELSSRSSPSLLVALLLRACKVRASEQRRGRRRLRRRCRLCPVPACRCCDGRSRPIHPAAAVVDVPAAAAAQCCLPFAGRCYGQASAVVIVFVTVSVSVFSAAAAFMPAHHRPVNGVVPDGPTAASVKQGLHDKAVEILLRCSARKKEVIRTLDL